MRKLVATLPTPLSILLADHEETAIPDWSRLFQACEWGTMYLENALRAQADYTAGLERRTSWGMRCQTIRVLTRQLEDSGHMPILQIPRAKRGKDVLERWVNLRNRWAHAPFSDAGSGENLSGNEITQMLFDLFGPMSFAQLLLVRWDQTNGAQGFELKGLRGLFDPQRVEIPDLTGGRNVQSLALRREGAPTVGLEPFLRYRSGRHGEHRVEFLASIRDDAGEYVDPLPQPGEEDSSHRRLERASAASLVD